MPVKPLALTMGDPAGCGPQITATAWHMLRGTETTPFAIIADPDIFEHLCPTAIITNIAQAADHFALALPVLRLNAPLPVRPVPGAASAEFAPAIIESIETATKLTLDGHAAAMITNPISKAVLYSAGFSHPGHTEFIAALCKARSSTDIRPVMMLVGGGLRVALATIHVPLMQVSQHLNQDMLIEIANITAAALRRYFGLPSPRLAFSGLNPHAGEEGAIGREEVDIINPAAAALRAQGIDIVGARPGDTVFHESLSGQYDAVIAMTHDQGLIPVKTLDMWGGVNTTLGLPVIRTSPDHGTAYKAAKAGTCRADSLIAAIQLAETMSRNRANDQ